MHCQKCYNTCHRYFGKVVRIEDVDGYVHIGKIVDVTNDSVWIEPYRSSFDTGFGYHDAYAGGGCDFCGGLGQCNHCGFGFDRGFGFDGGCGFDRGCGFDGGCRGGFCGSGAVELGFGFIFGIALAALFFI
ncbi:hypothetical protein [Bacillus cereus group sp. N21]|uniref:hypothetical protein n=1 Tax=Bacillus cereus group sp. N21 TaxID=2794591 RepID=UPI0018F77335|nr:hypothetical protein [Bacillus cereus group sp. N21]MBJ8028928.1 hypothetical protein [Bacillus cereus group sp. N21]